VLKLTKKGSKGPQENEKSPTKISSRYIKNMKFEGNVISSLIYIAEPDSASLRLLVKTFT
jgi:hypothetical protein